VSPRGGRGSGEESLRRARKLWNVLGALVVALSLAIPASARAPLYKVLGVVSDAATGEPLPFANLRILQTSRGTASNLQGAYLLVFSPGEYLVLFTYIGYEPDTVSVKVVDTDLRLDVPMRPTPIVLQPVTVSGREADPAAYIAKLAMRKKRAFLTRLHDYEFHAYSKTVLRVEKPGAQGDTMIAGILETQTTGYWQRPDKYKEVVTARRQSANLTPGNNVFSVGKIPNLNENVVILGRNTVVGPTAPEAFDCYSYEMVDTVMMGDLKIFRMRISPLRKDLPLFDGTISIADSTYSVMEVDVGGNEALDLAPLEDVHYRQQFSLFEGMFWLPVQLITRCRVNLSVPGVPVVRLYQVSSLFDYRINRGIPAGLFDEYLMEVEEGADRVSPEDWALAQVIPLTPQEERGYAALDSIVANASLFSKAALFASRSAWALGDLPVTSFSDFFHFNRVEGAYAGMGIRVEGPGLLPALELRTGYGVSDRRWKYAVSGEADVTSRGSVFVGGEVFDRLDVAGRIRTYSPALVTLGCLLSKDDYYDYFKSEGWRVFVKFRPRRSFSLELAYGEESQSSVSTSTNFSLLGGGASYRANPPISAGKMHSLRLSSSVDMRKFVDTGVADVPDVSRASWTGSMTAEYADEDALGGDFGFFRWYAAVCRRQLVFASGIVDVGVSLGGSSGTLPPQVWFDLPAGTGGFSGTAVFRTLRAREFVGDRMAALSVRYNLGSMPLRYLRIPVVSDLGLELVTHGAVGWTKLSGGSSSLEYSASDTSGEVFYEAGLGLGRVLTFFELDFTWRLSHRGRDDFTFTLGSSVF